MARSDGISVGTSFGEVVLYVMPRFDFLRLASMKFTSQIDSGRWLNSGFMFTSHAEDVHLRVGSLATPISRGPNES